MKKPDGVGLAFSRKEGCSSRLFWLFVDADSRDIARGGDGVVAVAGDFVVGVEKMNIFVVGAVFFGENLFDFVFVKRDDGGLFLHLNRSFPKMQMCNSSCRSSDAAGS